MPDGGKSRSKGKGKRGRESYLSLFTALTLGEGLFFSGLLDYHGHIVILLVGHCGDARRDSFQSNESSMRLEAQMTDLLFFCGEKSKNPSPEKWSRAATSLATEPSRVPLFDVLVQTLVCAFLYCFL